MLLGRREEQAQGGQRGSKTHCSTSVRGSLGVEAPSRSFRDPAEPVERDDLDLARLGVQLDALTSSSSWPSFSGIGRTIDRPFLSARGTRADASLEPASRSSSSEVLSMELRVRREGRLVLGPSGASSCAKLLALGE